MIGHSIIEEFLLCLQQISQLSHLKIQTHYLVTATVHSNFLLITYCLHAIIIKRGGYLVAFLFAESITKLELFNSTGPINYWLQLCVVAVFIYFVGKRLNFNLKAFFCYGIMILFMLMMAKDAWLYPKTKTFIYDNYANIIVCIHLIIIFPTIKFSKIRSSYRRFSTRMGGVWRNSYTLRYICYNLQQIPTTIKAKCQ
tara:strand:+ start:141 stop:734 length:594 start_codon:yes stop_codon:yes gene_type:complete